MDVNLKYISEEKSRHGKPVLYVRWKNKRVRLHFSPSQPEFFEEYRKALVVVGAIKPHRLDIGIAGNEQIAEQGFQKHCSRLMRVGHLQQVQQRMAGDLLPPFKHQPGHRGGSLCHHTHGAVNNGVFLKAFACQRGIIAVCPFWPPQ